MKENAPTVLPYSGNMDEDGEWKSTSPSYSQTNGIMKKPSSMLSPDSEIIQSDSMNLIDESAKQLFETMKTIIASSPEEINAACNCAKQIQSLMRLKLDVIRTKKGLY